MSSSIPTNAINVTASRCNSSSSSCSSLSGESTHWNSNEIQQNSTNSFSGEDDCTLNEMMGKYDESYIYEKETDILSDSDPTDCDTDIDTGQDGGDEDEAVEKEFDYIDNGSFLDFNVQHDKNTGHCTYYNFDIQRKTSRRRPSKKNLQQDLGQISTLKYSDKRRKSVSSKKRDRYESKSHLHILTEVDGTKSAGATPISIRKMRCPSSKFIINQMKKRSNSISFGKNTVNTINQRDKEADRKYKELIVEAEHILMSMKNIGLSPRRLPGPINKRVELLRSESVKSDTSLKHRLIDDMSNVNLSKMPSTNINNSRCSPKRNHITNFIFNNSRRLLSSDVEKPSMKWKNCPLDSCKDTVNSLISTHKTSSSMLIKTTPYKSEIRRSPKYRKKMAKVNVVQNASSSSESECDNKRKHNLVTRNLEFNGFNCPQSEPVKRKIYSHKAKTVAFNLNYESVCNLGKYFSHI